MIFLNIFKQMNINILLYDNQYVIEIYEVMFYIYIVKIREFLYFFVSLVFCFIKNLDFWIWFLSLRFES